MIKIIFCEISVLSKSQSVIKLFGHHYCCRQVQSLNYIVGGTYNVTCMQFLMTNTVLSADDLLAHAQPSAAGVGKAV